MGILDTIKGFFGGKKATENNNAPQANEPTIIDKASDWVENAVEVGKEKASDFADDAKEMAKNASEDIKETAEKVWDKVDDYVDPAIAKIKEVATPVMEKVGDFVQPAFDRVEDAADKIMEKVEDFIDGKKEEVATSEVVEKTEEVIAPVVDDAKEIENK